jgi:hypothetical protein
MRWITGIVAVLLIGYVTMMWCAKRTWSVSSAYDALAQEESLGRVLDQKTAIRNAFASFVEEICSDLKHCRISLRDASTQILTYARSFHPIYLVNINRLEVGQTDQEKVGRNVLRHFETHVSRPALGIDRAFVIQLELQLRDMTG